MLWVFQKAMMRDGGLFKCFVRNKYGEDNSKYTVIIRGKSFTEVLNCPGAFHMRINQMTVHGL